MILSRYKCVVCDKVTAGRLPRESRHVMGDGSVIFPRRHLGPDGLPCEGNIEDAILIEVYLNPATKKGKNKIASIERWWLKNRGCLPPDNGWKERRPANPGHKALNTKE